MVNPPPGPGPLQPGDPRLIVRWARRYAKSRTISFLVQWLFIVIMVIFVGIAATLTNLAYRDNNLAMVAGSVVFMVLCIVVLAWFSISPWGGDLIFRITQWLYGHEGHVAYSDESQADPRIMTALGGGLVIYHLVGAMLVSVGWLSLRHMQPYSALYMVPFLAFMIYSQRLGLWAWIWPALYGVHAVLLLAEAPIRFRGQWEFLNIIVPVFGYGLVAIIIGHLYSRYALYKLRTLTRAGLGFPGDPTDSGDSAP